MLRVILVLTVIISFNAFSSNKVNFKEGNWEVTSTMIMTGSPVKVPAIKSKQCITNDSLVPKAQNQSSGCKMLKNKINGDTVTWKIKCNAQGMDMVGDGSITYSGDKFKGSLETSMNGMTMTTKMSGKWIGKCK